MKVAQLTAVALLAAGLDATSVDHQTRDELAYSEPHYPSPWMDPAAPGWEQAYAKAKDFVSQLTLLEKVNLTTGVGWMGDKLPRPLHAGRSLGIRFADYISAFPIGITAGATWSRPLWQDRGYKMGSEAHDKGIDALLGPAAGPIGRAPTGGRNWEGFSADPYLLGKAFGNTIEGIQRAGVIATAKHYIANEQEHFRQVGSLKAADTTSAKPFPQTLTTRRCTSFTTGLSSMPSSLVLARSCARELGFQGFVMADWGAQHSGVSSAVAGLDMTMPGDTAFNTGASYWGGNLTLAVLNGTVPAYRLDDMVMRIMSAYFKVGRTIEGQPEINFSSWTRDTFGYSDAAVNENWEQVNSHVDVRGDHASHIRESAAKGTVLLKNTGSLPLIKPKLLPSSVKMQARTQRVLM
ncbi:unnamed protein product, partial [Clonostachys rosea f. rosea IK726]